MKPRLAIGRVTTSFGRSGEVKIESFSGETGHFLDLEELQLEKNGSGKVFRVETIRVAGQWIVVKLLGIDSPEEARKLRGMEVVVPRELASVCSEGEHYYGDIDGIEVRHEGSAVGRVIAIWEGEGRCFLEIRRNDGESRLVPYEEQFFGRVDVSSGVLDLLIGAVLE